MKNLVKAILKVKDVEIKVIHKTENIARRIAASKRVPLTKYDWIRSGFKMALDGFEATYVNNAELSSTGRILKKYKLTIQATDYAHKLPSNEGRDITMTLEFMSFYGRQRIVNTLNGITSIGFTSTADNKHSFVRVKRRDNKTYLMSRVVPTYYKCEYARAAWLDLGVVIPTNETNITIPDGLKIA